MAWQRRSLLLPSRHRADQHRISRLFGSTAFITALLVLPACAVADEPSPKTVPQVHSYEECVAAGFPILRSMPGRCVAPGGIEFTDPAGVPTLEGVAICKDLCGDGSCQEIVCQAQGCPCAETHDSCPQDCVQ